MARIIIAEDDRVTQIFYRKMIDFLGHDPVICGNGIEAVNEFKKEAADLVILDFVMPLLSGVEACRQIRRLPNGGASVPIVMVSSNDDESDIIAGINAGASDYMLKPVRETHLLAKLKIYLRMSSLHKNDFDLAKNQTVFSGRYKIRKMLGYGSHSIVFKCEDLQNNDRLLALKLFKRHSNCEEVFASFSETAAALRGIESEYLLKIHDYGRCDERLFVATDYADGGDLSRKLKGKTISQYEAARVGAQIVRAIAAITERGITHFDIKPENILLKDDSYLLGDFGIVTAQSGETISMAKEIWGSMAYMAPEYFTGDMTRDGASDIYSLGVTLYQALTCQNPFLSDRAGTVMFCQINLVPENIQKFNPDLDDELSTVITMMLDKNPCRRPDTEQLIIVFDNLVARFLSDESKKTALGKYSPPGDENWLEPMKIPAPNDDPAMKPEPTRRWRIPKFIYIFHSWLNIAAAVIKEFLGLSSLSGGLRRFAWVKDIIILFIIIISLYYGGKGVILICQAMDFGFDNDTAVNEGPEMIVMCRKCGEIEERKVKDISNISCRKCGGKLGVTYQCDACGRVFNYNYEDDTAVLENIDDGKGFYEPGCPGCGSADINPVMTSAEYLESVKERRRRQSNKN